MAPAAASGGTLDGKGPRWPATTVESKKRFSELMAEFKDYLQGTLSHRSSVYMYFSAILKLVRVHGLSLEQMATDDDFLRQIYESDENKTCRFLGCGLKMLRRFWEERKASKRKGRGDEAQRVKAARSQAAKEGWRRRIRAARAATGKKAVRVRRPRPRAVSAEKDKQEQEQGVEKRGAKRSAGGRRLRLRLVCSGRDAKEQKMDEQAAEEPGAKRAARGRKARWRALTAGHDAEEPAAEEGCEEEQSMKGQGAEGAALPEGSAAPSGGAASSGATAAAVAADAAAATASADAGASTDAPAAAPDAGAAPSGGVTPRGSAAPHGESTAECTLAVGPASADVPEGPQRPPTTLFGMWPRRASGAASGSTQEAKPASAAPASDEGNAVADGVPGRLATKAEEEDFVAMHERFGTYLFRVHKNATARSYRHNVGVLFNELHRAPSVMANSTAFLRFVEQMPRNKRANSCYSAALKAFRAFWASEKGGLKALAGRSEKSNTEPQRNLLLQAPAPAAPEQAEGKKDVMCVDLLDGPAEESCSSPAPEQKAAPPPPGQQPAAPRDQAAPMEAEPVTKATSGQAEEKAPPVIIEVPVELESVSTAVSGKEEKKATPTIIDVPVEVESVTNAVSGKEEEKAAPAIIEVPVDMETVTSAVPGKVEEKAPAPGKRRLGRGDVRGQKERYRARQRSKESGASASQPGEQSAEPGMEDVEATGPSAPPSPEPSEPSDPAACRTPERAAPAACRTPEPEAPSACRTPEPAAPSACRTPEPAAPAATRAPDAAPEAASEPAAKAGGARSGGAKPPASAARLGKWGPKLKSLGVAKVSKQRHNPGWKSVKLDEWIREVAARYKGGAPQRQEALFERSNKRQEHVDATLLEILRQRTIQVGLSPFTKSKLRKATWGDALLEEWAALASKKAEEQPRNLDHHDEEPGEEEDEDEQNGGEGGKKARAEEDEQRSKAWALVHTIRRVGERWPTKRPAQRWGEISAAKKNGGNCEEAREEHDAAIALKVMRVQFLEGALDDAALDVLLRLPECWALDMILTWQAHLMIKLRLMADAFPQDAPTQAQMEEDKEPARWVRDLRKQATSQCGVSAYLAAEVCAWLPWGAEVLSEWLPQQSAETKTKRPASEKALPLERLRQLVTKYPTAPPNNRPYFSSDEEREEKGYAVYLEKLSKLHFLGAITSEAVLLIAGGVPWMPDLVASWERNKAEGADPEETATIKRLQEIGERHPLLPPTQAAALERERWVWPHELRIRHADAWFLRVLKDKCFLNGLSEDVKNAMRAIPVWGAPRLEEWLMQKDQRAMQIFERQNRAAWRKRRKGEDGGEEADEASQRPRPWHEKRRTPPPILRDSDRLQRTGKEPRHHIGRVRVDRCHGKTVAEAVASVRTGVLRLTRRMIVQDIQSGHLRLEREGSGDGIASALGVVGPATPSRTTSMARQSLTGHKRPREERYRSLTGKVVKVERPIAKPNRPKELPELKDLTPGEIEQLGGEDLMHYERPLGWSSKRALSERLEKLSKELQANTLPWAASSAPAPEEGAAMWPEHFNELTPYQRLQLRGRELEHFEQQGLIADGKDLTLQERRERLKDHIWKLTGEGGAAAAKREQVFMKQWQATAANTPSGVTTIEDDDDDE